MSALLPCPFCGGAAEVAWYDGFPSARCVSCGCNTGMNINGSALQSAEAWNTRSNNAPSLLEALQELLGQVEQARDGFGIWPYEGSTSMNETRAKVRAAIAQATGEA